MLLLLVLAQMPAMPGQPMGPVVSSPATSRSSAPLAFFEAFTSSGAGTFGACSTTPPTGARGETLTFVRASSATCSRVGLATTGIANGDLSTLTSNQPRVEPDADGVLGLRVEASRTNVLLRFIDLANAAWSDVGTPSLTGGQTSPWVGTYATSGVSIDDNDGAAFEGRQQTVTVTASQPHTMHCYVKAGTADSASLSLDGTTASITGLSSTTWSIVEVTDASSSGTSIVAQARVGSTVAGTGTVVWGGCQVEQGTFRTSMMPTDGSSVTRSPDDRPYFTVSSFAVGSMAASLTPLWTSAPGNKRAVRVDSGGSDAARFEMYVSGTSLVAFLMSGSSQTVTQVISGLPAQARLAAWRVPSTTLAAIANGTETSAASVVGALSVDRVYVGAYAGSTGFEADGIVSNVCVDPDPTRCR